MSEGTSKGFAADTRSLEWNDLEVILAICRAECLAGAARALNVNHSTVSRRINAIEEKTGVRFFDRMPHGYFMTEAGEEVMAHAERIETEVHELGRKVLSKDMELSGRIRLTCSEGIAAEIAPLMVASFCKAHPNVSVDIVPGHSALDLSRREAEIAIRITRRPPESAFGRKVCDFGAALYSSREYIDRMRSVPVAEHDWCFIADTQSWIVPMMWPSIEQAEQHTVLTSRNAQGVGNAVAAGLGTMLNACHLADADPRMVRISENFPHLKMGVWVLTHPDLRRTARIRALMAHLEKEVAARRAEFAGTLRVGGTDILYQVPA